MRTTTPQAMAMEAYTATELTVKNHGFLVMPQDTGSLADVGPEVVLCYVHDDEVEGDGVL